jgi:hypothetical protein
MTEHERAEAEEQYKIDLEENKKRVARMEPLFQEALKLHTEKSRK